MKKIITYGIVLCLALSTLVGCGKKEDASTENMGPVIIQAGDSAVGSGGRKDTSSTETDNNTSKNETTNVENNDNSEITKEDAKNSISLVGVWLSNKGNCLEFRENQFTAYLNGKDIGGDYVIDGDGNLTLNYAVKTEIEDATEEQKLLGTNFNIETVSTVYSIQSYTEQATFILASGNDKEVFSYFGDITDVPDASGSEITDAEELEALNKQLEENGINPDTGLPLENEEKLIEMGIDPSTGLPLEVETEDDTLETIENNKK